ncbi:MAG: hypothetical protein WBC22_18160 [Sedimentisphaerales bacterium]
MGSLLEQSLPRTPSRPKTCLPHEIAQRYLFGVISVAKNLFTPLETCFCFLMGCNPRLINDLRSTKDYVRKNNLFMQNIANFQKVKLNVNEVLTKDYEQLDTWSIGKSKPIQSQSKPIKANIMPKQSQSKPISKAKKCSSPPLCCGIYKEKMLFCNRLTKKYQID